MRSSVAPALGILLVVLLGAAVTVWLILSGDDEESAGPEVGSTLVSVAEDPARYEGDVVTVSGEWADNEYFPPENADQVIVIGDEAGEHLVAVPKLGVAVPEVDEDTVLQVTGTVHLPERGDAGYIDRGGLLAPDDAGPVPVIEAELVEVAPGAEDAAPPPITREADQATVAELLRDPRNFDEAPVVVNGKATRLGGRGFVLRQSGSSIFVSAPASELGSVQGGDRVRVRADLGLLSGYGAEDLEDALSTDPPGSQPRSALPKDLPIEVGEPYLLLRAIEPVA